MKTVAKTSKLPDAITRALWKLDGAVGAWWEIPSVESWYAYTNGQPAELDGLHEKWMEKLEEAIAAVKAAIKGEDNVGTE